ncbi:YybH family protein [Pirellula sp. SH-Sr6A]|uniref:YybH family protein n=1 Tax=Pirellula sp. SH-Sr6A TaxID=1632865 RepID=UPI00143C47F6|nr:SgcJ/EcaC family oxidoreductase [Pirellula sp. SH-Sr6A]
MILGCVFWLVFPGLFNPALSQQPNNKAAAESASAATPKGSETEDSIAKQVASFASAFNKRDAKQFALFWVPQGEYIDESGETVVGREAIESFFTKVFEKKPEVSVQLITESIRVLSDSVAVEDGKAIVAPSPTEDPEVSQYTTVHLKVDGKWLIGSLRDSFVETDTEPKVLSDLEWLIGDWGSEENGVRSESHCRWIANNRFVERAYTTTQLDGSTTTGVQIIGWNAQTNQVQSWNFSPDGGHAVGVWSAIEGGWLSKVTGTTGTGESTMAVNVLKKLDDAAYVWQSIQRTVGDTPLPDTDEVIVRRIPSR